MCNLSSVSIVSDKIIISKLKEWQRRPFDSSQQQKRKSLQIAILSASRRNISSVEHESNKM
jgi:hypothetical protein